MCGEEETEDDIRKKCVPWQRLNRLTACSYVAPSESQIALGTNEIQTSEIVSFAKWVLFPVRAVDWEEFRSNNVAAILN